MLLLASSGFQALMVDLVEPVLAAVDVVGDPSCGGRAFRPRDGVAEGASVKV